MTLEEKVNITQGFTVSDNICAGNTGTVPRLNWPGMCLHDAGNGVRATDMVNSYPSAIHVGASWDKNLTYERGLYMGLEFKAKGGTIPILLTEIPWSDVIVNSERDAWAERRATREVAFGWTKL